MAFCVTVVVCGILCHSGSMWHSVNVVVCGILCHGGSMWHSVSLW